MSINKLIVDTLKPLNIPVSFQYYDGKADTYITFFQYMEQGGQFADNVEKSTEYFVQVDIWSKADYTTLVDSVVNAMKIAGFKRTSSADLYESDTKIYHKGLRFFIEI